MTCYNNCFSYICCAGCRGGDSCKKPETPDGSHTGVKEKTLKKCSLTIMSCCKKAMVMFTGLLGCGCQGGGMGFAGWHGKVKTLGYKGIKMEISFLKEAQFIRMAGWDLVYRFTQGRWSERGFGTTHPYQWETS